MLARLNAGERLYLKELEAEFGIHERTVLRDFSRLSYLPLLRDNGCYYLDMKRVRGQATNRLSNLLFNMGLESLFPVKLVNEYWQDENAFPFLFKNLRLEDTSQCTDILEQLSKAINQQQRISFSYQGQTSENIHPYRLVNDRGIWYLAATHAGQLYSYRLAKISQIQRHEDKYKPSKKVHEEIHRQGMEWLTYDNAEVLIQVDHDIAPRFLEASILPNQQLLKELSDGSLLISSRVSRLSDIIPLLKSWMPQIEVLSPASLKLELIRELYASLDRCKV